MVKLTIIPIAASGEDKWTKRIRLLRRLQRRLLDVANITDRRVSGGVLRPGQI